MSSLALRDVHSSRHNIPTVSDLTDSAIKTNHLTQLQMHIIGVVGVLDICISLQVDLKRKQYSNIIGFTLYGSCISNEDKSSIWLCAALPCWHNMLPYIVNTMYSSALFMCMSTNDMKRKRKIRKHKHDNTDRHRKTYDKFNNIDIRTERGRI